MIKFFKYTCPLFGIAVLFVFFMNCQFSDTVSKDELISFVNDEANGLCNKKELEGVQYTITYKPIDLIIVRWLKKNSSTDLDSLRSSFKNTVYFSLDISVDSTDAFGRMSANCPDMLKVVSFGLQEHIILKDETGQEFYLSDFVYPRLYGNTNKTSVLLCFENENLNLNGDLNIYCSDFINGSIEKIKFNFKNTDITKIPKLRYE